MKTENADRAVTEAFLAVAGSWPEVEEIEEVTAPGTVAELRDIEAELREAASELIADGVDAAGVLRRMGALKERRAVLQAIPSSVTTRVVPTGRTVSEAWEASDTDNRRKMLLIALDHVSLTVTATKGHTGYHPERIRLHWNS